MDHQGAGFAFDSNMDFSNMFAATPETLFKPADNTSGFFFADEGIDTTASSFMDPVTLGTPQQGAFDMNIPSAASYYPQTPASQFLASMPTQLNTYGKRPLQLEADDFPQSKRQASYDFPLFPTPPATNTTSSWGLEATPSTTTVEGLSDEAADVCATWFTNDRHIDSLSQLTGESADAIRSWFGQLLKQGMGKGGPSDSAYKSQTAHIQQQDSFWNDHTYQTDLLQTSPSQPLLLENITTPEISYSQDNVVSTTVQPVTATRSCKKRCTPTDDLELLGRDPRKIYQCTRKCGKRYGRKNDWKRKEEEGYPCKKYHFVQHFRNIHADVDPDQYEEASVVYSETEFPRKCGFCRHRFSSRQERIDHIADHFKQGKCMLDWRDDDDNSGGDDSTDDDNDDRPSGDGFDGSPSFQPPPFHPHGNNSKPSGDQGSSGGSLGQPPQSGFFHFQLSQLGESQRYCAVKPTRPTTLSPNISPSSISIDRDGTAQQDESFKSQHPLDKYIPTKGDYKATLAGDAFAQPMIREGGSSQDERTDKRGLEHTSGISAAASTEIETLISTLAPSWNQVGASLDELSMSEENPSSESLPDATVTARSQCSDATDQLPNRQSTPHALKFSRAFHSIKLLGAGGFSTVDEVKHQQTGLRIGRKTLKNRNQTALEELKKEVNVLQKLRHPHIIRFLGAYSKGDKMSILLSPVAETTLAVWLDRSALQRPTNLFETIMKMFGCLSSSVRYLHEQRPVVKHMDIKPQNILIVDGDQEFPHVILSDFGVSCAEDVSDEQSRPWTRQYIAPEVVEGFTRKQAADIWSLGCVFAEMASVPLSQHNSEWSAFSREYNGRTGTYYWQDVPGVQKKLAMFFDSARSPDELLLVRALQAMLRAQPDERPDAASLTMIFAPAPCCLNWPNDKMTFPGPHEELLEVERFGKHHRIDGNAQPHLHHKDANDCSDSVPIAKTWLDNCLCTHSACRHLSSGYSTDLPRRLIDILPEGQASNYVRIVESESLEEQMQHVQYVALSHVWSDTEPLLSSNSQSKMQSELVLEALPSAVRNAISEVQRLGFRYCWLDSLCVLQDSDQEKEQECTNMSSIFRNAVLTVVLDQLANASTRKDVENATKNAQFASTISPIKNRTTIATPASALLPSSVLTVPNLGWDTRAWALQDRLLSRRFLHLGEQSYWECNTLKASETFPRGLPALLWEKVHTQCSDDGEEMRAQASSAFPSAKIFAMEFDDAHNANTIPHQKPAEPRPPLPGASRLRDCQWVKKQGDDAARDANAVLAMLGGCESRAEIPQLDDGVCVCCSDESSSSMGICRSRNGNGEVVEANANADARIEGEGIGEVFEDAVEATGLV
ncbi:hypothetical protein J3E72DRAFT_227946 [Bipolaris maydis]|nr:hypothetical protein J3E74DRAFT_254826 [Bipolaris maydis]KAJ6191900.1 hypothetical protein J3E72DRAFT_254073 [Bipolaris maydis]KAJ6192943.1 hypothetical protein J3E72DRAFT_227946 [Bipolaris maydis]